MHRGFCSIAGFTRCFQWENSSVEMRGLSRKWSLHFYHVDSVWALLVEIQNYWNYWKIMPLRSGAQIYPLKCSGFKVWQNRWTGTPLPLSPWDLVWAPGEKEAVKTWRAKAWLIDDKGGGWDFPEWPFRYKISDSMISRKREKSVLR